MSKNMFQDEKLTNIIENYEKKIYDLRQLIELSKGLNSSLSLNALIESILLACMGQMQLTEAGIFLKKTIVQDNYVLSRNYKGFDIEHNREFKIPGVSKLIDYLETNSRCFTLDELINEIKDKNVLGVFKSINPALIVPLKGKGKLNGIIVLGKRIHAGKFTLSEKEYLLDIASIAGIAVHNANLYEMTTTDMMTKLKIHQFFQLALFEEMESAKKENKPLCLTMIDIDHFKRFNDTYGHTFGDIVLKRVAEIMRENTRYNDIVARYGGEEFSIIFPDTEMEEAKMITERLRKKIEKEKFDVHGEKVGVTISAGISTFDKKKDTTNENFIDKADKGLYMSKMNGRNIVSCI
jgi:two-component system cell cycle response regulator